MFFVKFKVINGCILNRKCPITRYLSSEHNFLYNKNIKEGMEENKMSKQIVPLEVGHSSKKKRNLLRLY